MTSRTQTEEVTPEGNFLKLCKRVLEYLSSMIKDARDEGLSKIDPTQLDSAARMLAAATPKDLITSFVEKRQYWHKIGNRDMVFLEKEIGVLFADAGILQAEVVEEPIRVYLLLKKWKNDPASRTPTKKAIDYDNPCLKDADIDDLWKKFDLMIKLTCKWNIANGRKYDLQEFEARYLQDK